MNQIERAADAIREADAIFVGAGAGMGVDSGLPDFRGDSGFWKAYPPFRERGLNFVDLANPRWFRDDPTTAWGFYGHRLNLYRETVPHEGFGLLLRWGAARSGGAFVFTSNVDGQFQQAGFGPDEVCECHGSIHHLQCVQGCEGAIWDASSVDIEVTKAFEARAPLPKCPRCQALARPNVLMFGDSGWVASRTETQTDSLRRWMERARQGRMVVIECGAGQAVPTVRWQCERVASAFDAPLIRINPREPDGPTGTISIASGALEALRAIDEAM